MHYRQSISYPCIPLGDMNFVPTTEEKSGGHPHTHSVLDISREFVNRLGLHDMSYFGNIYTWTNKRYGSELVQERLDRFLGIIF